MKRIFEQGEIVRHFKRQYVRKDSTEYLYRIIGEAEHTETGERLMIYQALYGSGKAYARPLAMFTAETDHAKYPDAVQKYRFEKADEEDLKALAQKEKRLAPPDLNHSPEGPMR